jgi:diguanylate cyclase (GGDEF)-like protein
MAVKNALKRKGYLAAIIMIVLLVVVSITSISSIQLLQGNARVVNYGGIVRGATQKLIKEEIMGWYLSQNDPAFGDEQDWYPNDALMELLDSIVEELLTGEGPNDLVVLPDEEYLSHMGEVRESWEELKELIMDVRAGADPTALFESSQAYFELVNNTVFAAEAYSETQVDRIKLVLLSVNGIFVLLIVFGLIFYARSLSIKRRADVLGKLAYIDTLTGLDNRASCERLTNRVQNGQADMDIAVIMFDMNDLKLTNDFFGHQGGDKIITAFAEALKESAEDGFVGRYGGDEFLAVFEQGDKTTVETFLQKVRESTARYNEKQQNKLEMIHYAAGYVVANIRNMHIDDIIHEADNRMYANKRKLKRK